jgi:hypothetical protein
VPEALPPLGITALDLTATSDRSSPSIQAAKS